MNVSAKILIIAAAYVALYLSCETSAAAIVTEEDVDNATTKDASEAEAATMEIASIVEVDGTIPDYLKAKGVSTAGGEILDEKITTEDVSGGEIPHFDYTQKTATEDENGSFFDRSSSSFSSFGNGKSESNSSGNEGEEKNKFDMASAFDSIQETQRMLTLLSNMAVAVIIF